jgi:transposase-like protein
MIEVVCCGTKDLAMRKQGRFSAEFKRRVVEELLSGMTGPAQLCRRHNFSSDLLYHREKQYRVARSAGDEVTVCLIPNEKIMVYKRRDKLAEYHL